MFIFINTLGFFLIIVIAWWFWWSRGKAERIHSNLISIAVKNGIYSPACIEVPAYKDIVIEFFRVDPSPCAEYIVFDSLNIRAKLPLNEKYLLEIGKLKPGHYEFTCQMKMYRGELIAVEHF